MLRRQFLASVTGACAWPQARAEEPPYPKEWSGMFVIQAPDDPARWPAHCAALQRWREDEKKRLNYDDSLYRRADFSWVPSSFACCFLMMCDEMFYNREKNRYE